jgi:hypothetical protein
MLATQHLDMAIIYALRPMDPAVLEPLAKPLEPFAAAWARRSSISAGSSRRPPAARCP